MMKTATTTTVVKIRKTTRLITAAVTVIFMVIMVQVRRTGNHLQQPNFEIEKHPVANETANGGQWLVDPETGTVTHHGSFDHHIGRNYSLAIDNRDKCTGGSGLLLLVAVLSAAANFERRQLIRETWALDVMQQIGNYRVVFVVGLTATNSTTTDAVQERIRFENMIYRDLLQINIRDSFENLTYKSINILRWYTEHCRQARFLYKTDDDIYLHMPNVLRMAAGIDQARPAVWCRRNRRRKIIRAANIKDLFLTRLVDRRLVEESRTKFRKYIVEQGQLPGIHYPDYCSGYGYMMSYTVAERLFQASRTIPYIGIEDVFITGFCRQKANISVAHSEHFSLNPVIHPVESRCAFETGRLNSNELSPGAMKTLWLHVNTQGYYCKLPSLL